MSEWKAKRFWKEAVIDETAEGFGIALDGRAVKTPAKRALIAPTRPFAEKIAAEWNAQGEQIDPATMPFTRSANAALDKVAVQKQEVADMLAAYGDSDLLCYRAEYPEGLVARQAAQWDPLLDWAADALGARLDARAGVMHVPQAPEALAVLTEKTRALSSFELAGFHDLVSLSGSLILGFAATHDFLPAKTIWDISRLDEIWQAEEWGRDAEAEAAAAIKEAAFIHAKQVFDLSFV
ncbi:ATPase [Roseobacter denitrificans]|uniref:ATP12 chaperone protein, putative n=1 Tax=Roseobacter denitrificans (strain ATCC 33942 / OCh 114) TaxID=375451 RepID=Q16AB2_ROSDO|nr:ATP12 family protein [Roseobacter denitrificans]ABG31081.1 ATP12 chaperone protein, putative [Roseobacter denitrificans OCh 114]AVL54155.1 ATPase [Roseobacter denitrificans]SFG33218.1 Chaperone required for the assembly of the F1-ATPase [Roseobacter denitrificans OCh 114]